MKKYRFKKEPNGEIIEGDDFCELVHNYDPNLESKKEEFIRKHFPDWKWQADGYMFPGDPENKQFRCYIIIIILLNLGKISKI